MMDGLDALLILMLCGLGLVVAVSCAIFEHILEKRAQRASGETLLISSLGEQLKNELQAFGGDE